MNKTNHGDQKIHMKLIAIEYGRYAFERKLIQQNIW